MKKAMKKDNPKEEMAEKKADKKSGGKKVMTSIAAIKAYSKKKYGK